jgi:DNA-binding NarL/FixJ family response regulator
LKLLIIDDHQLVRDGLRLAFSSQDNGLADLELIEADSHATALMALAEHPDLRLVLLDLRLTNASTWDLLREITRHHPRTLTAILSASRDGLDIESAFRFGAAGFISKEESVDGLRRAVRTLLANERYISASLGYLVDSGRFPRVAAQDAQMALTSLQRSKCSEYGFTDREIQVFERALGGSPNKVIASELAINENTVKAHLSSVYAKLGVRSRVQALALFLR